MIPRFVPPQLATLVDAVPIDPGWMFETKYDGYRIECLVRGHASRLISRNAKDWTDKFAPIAAAAENLPVKSALLDGEVVVLDSHGRMSFRALQQYFEAPNPERIRYYAFDLLELNGTDTRGLPLVDRRKLLRAMLAGSPARSPIRASRVMRGTGKRLLDGACRLGLEGLIGKRKADAYESGRTRSWVKIKCGKRQEFVVVGFTPPGGARRGFGALALAVMERGRLRFAGRVGTGFSDATLSALRKKLDALRTPAAPVADVPRAMARDIMWVRPALVAEVAFTEWTDGGLLRHPSFQGLREDKSPREVTREAGSRKREAGPDPR